MYCNANNISNNVDGYSTRPDSYIMWRRRDKDRRLSSTRCRYTTHTKNNKLLFADGPLFVVSVPQNKKNKKTFTNKQTNPSRYGYQSFLWLMPHHRLLYSTLRLSLLCNLYTYTKKVSKKKKTIVNKWKQIWQSPITLTQHYKVFLKYFPITIFVFQLKYFQYPYRDSYSYSSVALIFRLVSYGSPYFSVKSRNLDDFSFPRPQELQWSFSSDFISNVTFYNRF